MRHSARLLTCALGGALLLASLGLLGAAPALAQALEAPSRARLVKARSDEPPTTEQRESRTLTYAGISLLLAGVVTDASFWAAVDTSEDAAPWAWHLVPIAGPVIGLTDVDTLCPGGDSQHSCSLPKGMAYVGAAVSLVLQSAGLVLLLAPRSGAGNAGSPPSAQRVSLPVDLAVNHDKLLLRAHWVL